MDRFEVFLARYQIASLRRGLRASDATPPIDPDAKYAGFVDRVKMQYLTKLMNALEVQVEADLGEEVADLCANTSAFDVAFARCVASCSADDQRSAAGWPSLFAAICEAPEIQSGQRIVRAAAITPSRVKSKLEPNDGQLILAAWIDTYSNYSWGSLSGKDSPGQFNKRLGWNASAFQFAQNIPPTPVTSLNGTIVPNLFYIANMTSLDDATDAALYLTVYPALGLGNVTAGDIQSLAQQCANVTMIYGNQPTEFVAQWIQVYQALQATAPAVAMVWSPSFGTSSFDANYAAYWPGAQYVDWVGLSVYWKGFNADYPWEVNNLAPSNYIAQIMDAAGSEGSNISFYQSYAVQYSKPFM
ncbi:hypothetical protein HDU98_002900, partial [Podochytrium sp. JEL0797]